MFKIIAKQQTMKQVLFATMLCAGLFACNELSNGTGNLSTDDTSSGVITTPHNDTSNVVTPPATNDSNVVNTDSMGTAR